MESFGSFFDEEWESLSTLFSGDQDSGNFSSHGLFSSQQDHALNFETPSNVSSFMNESNNANYHGFCYASENTNPNYFYHYFSQETSNNGCVAYNIGATSLPYPSSNTNPNHDQVDIHDENKNTSSLLAQVLSDFSMEEILCMRQDVNIDNSVDPSVPISDELKNPPMKRKIEMSESQDAVENKVNDEKQDEKPKKKTRVARDNKNKKKVQPKKKQKVMDATTNDNEIDGDQDTNNKKGVGNAPIASTSSCSSEDDLNAVNSNWKTRAGRGAATDPQSLYARKRRERINERLKVLQNLVPNGTKVDISTMLEEAVQYVKFLQLQIKLLSSDEMWMYAPIAYNGMDMGLYQKLSQS